MQFKNNREHKKRGGAYVQSIDLLLTSRYHKAETIGQGKEITVTLPSNDGSIKALVDGNGFVMMKNVDHDNLNMIDLRQVPPEPLTDQEISNWCAYILSLNIENIGRVSISDEDDKDHTENLYALQCYISTLKHVIMTEFQAKKIIMWEAVYNDLTKLSDVYFPLFEKDTKDEGHEGHDDDDDIDIEMDTDDENDIEATTHKQLTTKHHAVLEWKVFSKWVMELYSTSQIVTAPKTTGLGMEEELFTDVMMRAWAPYCSKLFSTAFAHTISNKGPVSIKVLSRTDNNDSQFFELMFTRTRIIAMHGIETPDELAIKGVRYFHVTSDTIPVSFSDTGILQYLAAKCWDYMSRDKEMPEGVSEVVVRMVDFQKGGMENDPRLQTSAEQTYETIALTLKDIFNPREATLGNASPMQILLDIVLENYYYVGDNGTSSPDDYVAPDISGDAIVYISSA